jgi:hypothetical protein
MERNNVNNSPITGEDSKKVWITPQVNEYEIPETEASPTANAEDGGGLYES